MVYPVGKRLVDLGLSLGLIMLFSPVFMVLLLFLFYKNRGHPFFFQDRPGKNGEVFKVIKFKTMKDTVDAQGIPLPDSLRMTRMGKWIRESSMDELPQLLNVLRGEMSMVGPRPLLVEYLPLYSKQESKRHSVKPGITGWAQVNGRNSISWQEKFQLDVWYVDNQGFLLDLQIMLWTFWDIIRRKGVSQQGHVTIGKFTGTIDLPKNSSQYIST